MRVSIVNTTPDPKIIAVGEWLGNLHDVEVLPGQDCGTSSADAVTTAGDRKQDNARPDRQHEKPVPMSRESVVNVRSDQQQQKPVPAPRKSVAVRAATVSTSDEIVGSLLQQLPDDLEVEQRRQVSQFLQKYQNVFSTSTYDMGSTTLVEHEINTGGHPPIRQGLRRHPIAHLDIIDEQVREMVQNDLVEPAASPWAANVVLVRKKDETYRLCVDYRALNAVTYQDTYPLPHIDTCLGSMDGATWFSTLDLRSDYHNIPIREQDKDKTAFITRRGCFRYKVLPFGLTTAPSVFQRLMDLVLCGLTYVTCLVYI